MLAASTGQSKKGKSASQPASQSRLCNHALSSPSVRILTTRFLFAFRHSLNSETLFPLALTFDELEDSPAWKLLLDYDREVQNFKLSINALDFFHYPYQSQGETDGPQLIENSSMIKLNNKRIEMSQWSAVEFHRINRIVNKKVKTTKV